MIVLWSPCKACLQVPKGSGAPLAILLFIRSRLLRKARSLDFTIQVRPSVRFIFEKMLLVRLLCNHSMDSAQTFKVPSTTTKSDQKYGMKKFLLHLLFHNIPSFFSKTAYGCFYFNSYTAQFPAP